MAGGDTPYCAAGITVSVNRLGDAVVKLRTAANHSTADKDEVNVNLTQAEQSDLITVFLAYAEEATRQHYQTVQVRQGTTLYEALAQAGWLKQFEELASWCEQVANTTTPTAKRWHVGVYAQKQPLNYILQPSDRVEVYRSLSADPMSQRKNKSRS